MRYLLDSTVLIDCLRGRPAAQRVLELEGSGDTPCTTPINVEEVVRGLRPQERPGAEELFGGLVVYDVATIHGWLAGRWRAEFAGRGVTLSQADCLIAAIAVESGTRLCTGNPKHFPMVDTDHWPVGA